MENHRHQFYWASESLIKPPSSRYLRGGFFSLNYSMHISVRQGFFREDKETVLVNPRRIWYTVKQDGHCFSYGFNVHGV